MPRCLSIELNEAGAKVLVLQYQKRQGVTLENAFSVSFEEVDRESEDASAERARILKESLKEQKTGRPPAALVIPKQSAVVRKVRLPSTDLNELSSMAQFEAEKFIPFNVERHIISHVVLQQESIEGSEVMIAAVDEPVIAQWLEVLGGAGVDPVIADVTALSLARGYTFQKEQTAAAAEDESPAEDDQNDCEAIIHVGMVHTDITLLRGGEVLTTRSVMHGAQHLVQEVAAACGSDEGIPLEAFASINVAEPDQSQVIATRRVESARVPQAVPVEDEDTSPQEGDEIEIIDTGSHEDQAQEVANIIHAWVQKLITNLQRTYEFALREFSVPQVRKFYLSGEGALFSGIDHVFSLHIGVPGEIHNPLGDLKRAKKCAVEGELLPAYNCAFGSGLRLLLGEEEHCINLLPEYVLERQLRSERQFQYLITGTLFLIALFMGYMLIHAQTEHHVQLRGLYTQYNEQMEEIVEDLEDKARRTEIIKRERSDRAGVLEILEAISKYDKIGPTPQGRITLERFDYELGKEVVIDGQALEINDITDFIYYLTNLENEEGPVFEFVREINSSTYELPRRGTIYKFKLRGVLM